MRFVWAGLFLVLTIALFVALARTWRARTRRQAALVPPMPVPTTIGPVLSAFDGFVVATTFADAPLERVSAGGLGFRARGGFRTHREGVVLVIAGVADRFIPMPYLRGADRANVAIDRVVEPGGLVRLRWTATGAAGATDLDTYFRFPQGDAAAMAALRELLGDTDAEPTTSPDRQHTPGEGEQQ
ncbi:PH-like domain-containing protein [Curtobacterium ammoniigenes]|uniref:PH-like domain-containing protein n=1 Tax=Curtobacterium ammoniigenes TaxID=395387 RepID=UPI0008297309|nr:hypothetical protein [Curtobacterium ammoniigenes]